MRAGADRHGPRGHQRPLRGDQAGERDPAQVRGEEEDCEPRLE